jgi:adenylate kinase family enzyme
MRRAAVMLLMGLPGSGKTTLCQKLLEMRPEGVQFRHICYDELLKFNEAEKWRDSRNDIIKQVEHLIVNSVI